MSDPLLDLDPVVVTSVSPRCGTTLVQRLLCSSANTLVYGERAGEDLQFFLGVHAAKSALLRAHRGHFTQRLEDVLGGRVDDWILDLLPPVDGYLDAMATACFAGLSFCREHAASVGRPVWGVKYPGWGGSLMDLLHRLLPRARVVYMERDLGDCLRSAKALGSVTSGPEAQAFCAQWGANAAFAQGLAGRDWVLRLPYGSLVADPEGTVARLQSFTGARGIDTRVVQKRINASVDDSAGRPEYRAPVALTTEEQGMVDATIALVEARSLRGGDPR